MTSPPTSPPTTSPTSPPTPVPIAVVGMDCRLPGAPDVAAFHRLLLDGRTVTGPAPADRRPGGEGDDPVGTDLPAAFLDDAATFDAGFFGIAPAEAAAMDPQQRLLLQTTWRAVEDSGISPRALAGTDTSVHVGIMSSEWGTLHLGDHRAMTVHRGSGNGYCMAANRLSYHLDLKGPSLAVDTACSSSLVAVHLACTSLRAGEVDTAIAAGVNLILTPALSVFYAAAGLAAPDGRCKPFAAGADGIGRGEGVGVVVLRRLDDAVRDGQPIHAVIDGGAVGSDGRSNGLTAPNRFSQAEVVRTALRRSGVQAGDVTFVEGHGTGTRLGDMIEVRALGDVHAGRRTPLLLGSVKGNLGHLEGAAGVTGLIKACLALEHRVLPPTPGGGESPELKLAEHGLSLATSPTRLPGGTLRAGVSSFGLGGTNVHLVLSSPPKRRTRPGAGDDAVVLVTGGATRAALRANLQTLTDAVDAEAPARIGQLAWTSAQVRTGHRHRLAVAATAATAASALAAAAAALDAPAAGTTRPGSAARRLRPSPAFVFTGQGSQYAGMGAALHRRHPAFRRRLDEASAAIGPVGDARRTVADLIRDPRADLDPTAVAQPALFAVGYAAAAALVDAGVRPAVLLGHSIGEFAAAVIGGALTLDAAARLVVARGALMQALPAGGAMLSVRAGAGELREVLGRDLGSRPAADATAGVDPGAGVRPGGVLDVAALNGPLATVLSGDAEAIERAARACDAAGLRTKRLTVSHAFHSALLAPVVEQFRELAAEVDHTPLRIPLASTVRGTLLPAGTVLDAGYWADQVCSPVRFAEAAAHLHAAAPTHVVEAGPRPVLLGMLRRVGEERSPARGLAAVPGPDADGTELAAAVAALHTDGLDPDWTGVFDERQQVLHRLPGYRFATDRRYWFEESELTSGRPLGIATARPPRATIVSGADAGIHADRPVAVAVVPAPAGAAPSDLAAGLPGVTVSAPTGTAGVAAAGAAETAAAGAGERVAAAVLTALGSVSGHTADALVPHARLGEDLGVDSVMAIRLADELEPHLGALDLEAMVVHLTTVGGLINHLESRYGVTGGAGEGAMA